MAESVGITGHCLCGAVRYRTTAASHDVQACHCGMCRRWAGGPLMFLDTIGAVSFDGREHVGIYRSSETGERGFCTRCGSVLFWKVAGEERYTFTAGSLDDPVGLVFVKEIFIEDKPGFYDFANATEKVAGAEAMTAYVSGSGEPD
ncbi:MAG: GFA family protein [Hyphomicrobium sp.]|uniref:GFA family protein n=1 Tax=Hyphomicrobium sp. TaxID=82 RepID=UPI003D1391BB